MESGLSLSHTDPSRLITARVAQFTVSEPGKPLLTWLDAQGRPEASYTYDSFDRAARGVAAHLLGQGLRSGDVAILAYTPGADFFIAFWACMLSGIVAVPVVPPLSRGDVKKFLRVVNDSDARVVLMDRTMSRIIALKMRKDQAARLGRRFTTMLASGAPSPAVTFADLEPLWRLTTTGVAPSVEPVPLEPQPPDEPAFLMYSSGTTSHPKGARTTFHNLSHQLEMNRSAVQSGPESISCWWAPHYHDYGLISGFLNVLYSGASAVCCSPLHFIQRPVLWLEMLHRYRATHTFGPDFAYLLLIRKTRLTDRTSGTWDLSTLRVAMSAAEKVRFATLVEFTEAFASCGFRWEMFCPAYGLAEHTVGVTINSCDAPPVHLHVVRSALEQLGKVYVVDIDDPSTNPTGARTVALVGSGTTHLDTDVRIVRLDEDGQPVADLGPDEVGEIWVSSPSKTAGYHKLPALTEAAFFAKLPGSDGQQTYLRTGDLGFLSSHTGELFVCGRQKEMIIVAGKNHFSEDIELTLAEHGGHLVRPGRIAAFSLEDERNGTEVLAIAAEMRDPKGDCSAAIDIIRRSVSAAHKITVSQVALVPPGGLPKTSSGKLRRVQARRDLQDGHLPILRGGHWSDTALPGNLSGVAEPDSSLVGFLDEYEQRAAPAPPSQPPALTPPPKSAPPSGVVTHPVALSQSAILTYHFLRMQRFSDWNIDMQLWLDGPLSTEALSAAVVDLCVRHSILRTTFELRDDGQFEQWIHPTPPEDLLQTATVDSEDEAKALALASARRPMDVTQEVLRVAVYQVSPQRALLQIVIHHALSDGWTAGLLLRETGQRYAWHRELPGAMDTLAEPVLQFSDYARWQRALIDAGHFDGLLQHWQMALRLPVPTFTRSPARVLERGESTTGVVRFSVDRAAVEQLKARASQWKTSVNILLLGSYAAVLCEAGDQDEILVQVPAANRPPGSEGSMGCFVENMLLRLPRAEPSAETAATLHTTVRSGLRSLVPLPLLLERLSLPEQSASRLHRVVLNWGQMSTFLDDLSRPLGDLSVTLIQDDMIDGIDIPEYAYSVLNINEQVGGTIQGLWQYDRRVFTAQEMDRLVSRYVRHLNSSGTNQAAIVFGPDSAPAGLQFSSRLLFGET